MFRLALFNAVLAATLASAHVIITYPGTRGNNFITNGTFPLGMQWEYPCGGLSLTTNRSFWPTSGGVLAWQPGWFQGHKTAFLYVNIGWDKDGPDGGPNNLTTQLVNPFQLIGPSNTPYPGTICLDKITMPEGLPFKAGDNATIQVVEIAAHGASLFSCSDITFVDPGDKRIPEINGSNCFNTAELGFAEIHSVTIQKPMIGGRQVSGAESVTFWYFNKHSSHSAWKWLGWLPAVIGGLWIFL